ncbi:hypothetical protein [Chryseobacterium sp. Leaf180]|uniref:hypothetical protein n=1 Tax=Chryseobacterium sp. Leaf180 TaxID=1736289 RepID=UPI000A9F8113|nr:hypothetical protein [Chryseobacterium sp. Leaf180]
MKKFLYILIALVTGCKEEKSFADDIVLSFPKEEKLSFQNFNDDMNEMGTYLIYIGKDASVINVKYYKYIFPPPPPPPKINENTEEYMQARKHFEDSINFIYRPFFNPEAIQIKETEEDLYKTINNQTTQIIVKEKDTIPLYARNYETEEVKKYKAFPVFIKNISSKTLRIPIEAQAVGLYILNDKKFQYIRNSDYLICGMGSPKNPYFELKPNEILIYSYPHLKKGHKRKGKISFHKATSKEFEISIDEEIIKNQRSIHYLQ